MELGGSLPHSQQSTTCPYPSQINTFLCPSHFWQVQLVSFLVGLRTYQQPGTHDPQISRLTIRLYWKKTRMSITTAASYSGGRGFKLQRDISYSNSVQGFLQPLQENGGSGRSCTTFFRIHHLQLVVSFLSTNITYISNLFGRLRFASCQPKQS